MQNLSASLKKFMGNKNTVTIIGVILCVFILYFGYNYRINQKVKLIRVPYATQTIQPRTLITNDMIGYMEAPKSFLVGDYIQDVKEIVGKYSNYNTMIANGSLFYRELVTESSKLPDAALQDVPTGYTVINYAVNMSTTYANTMYPGNYINIYYKSLNDEEKVMFGRFLGPIKILDVKDASGQRVFETTAEARTPAYMLFAVPEEYHLLLRKALYLQDYEVELILIPNTEELSDKQKNEVNVNSEDIKTFIEEHTKNIEITKLPELDNPDVTTNNKKDDNNENTTTKKNNNTTNTTR